MIPVIYYHSIAPKKNQNWFRNFLTLETEYFEAHLKLLKDLRYQTISLDEYLDRKNNGVNSNEKLAVLTFDDGYLDNYVFAYPLLKKYGFSGTIFVNTDYIDRRTEGRRKTLADYWQGTAEERELQDLGFLNPEEMRFLDSSGVMRIESHTKSHDMYNVSDKIIGFHRPGCECLYPIVNLYPEQKPYYAGNPEFEKMIPFGTPFFEEKSAVIAKRVHINPELTVDIAKIFRDQNWTNPYNFENLYSKIEHIYNFYRHSNSTVTHIESNEEYETRVRNDVREGKLVLEKELEREVRFLCWPHGDNNEFSNRVAEEVGFRATTLGKGKDHGQPILRFDRIGLDSTLGNKHARKWKSRYKLGEYAGEFPWSTISKIYHALKGA